ncbi:ABC transporter substrate-binding protein [Paenibacillus macquariensis]|uniref:Multiple sugar transport system substrate-binding protein n=1 Tax=Paenibacillus macquariensis TaxID=948756 RepID=A0ABY1KGP6_9BACL|nr:extracellular solute-binding protein [Paenibacillus macquariensis]MEC0093939.1 extracellular solute-binding protein [Paenibacillus macquariensis]OAB26910.1 ABC transporter substrate-binding protein [Paenibacillus macquariensis subsp. macquariensis]SIR71394.1 multiple sugar transport system substrate-binding protein [Paenibacillus macquariensis]
MKKMLLMLLTIILMISVSACSSRAGNGDVTQTQNEDKATEKPNGEKTEGTKPSGGKKTVVFSTFFPDEFFKEAKKKYEAKHPNITIDLTYIESGDGAQGKAAYEKFIKTTNTAMLSGKGPDLVEMDQLPVENYVKKHLLANMSEIIKKDPTFKKEQYFNNILDNVKIDGGIYGMPLKFLMYGLMGDETLIENSKVKFDDKTWNWSQYTDVSRQLMKFGEKTGKYGVFSSPDALLNEMVKDQYPTFVDEVNEKVNFDSGTFTKLLKQVKSLSDERIITQEQVHPLFRTVSINSPTDYINTLKESEFNMKGYEFKSKLYAKPSANDQQTGGYFRTYRTIGINEKSSVKEEAWDFLKFMLSDEIQAPGTGFPLNKSLYEKQKQQLLKEGKVKSIQEMEVMKGKIFEVTAKDIQGLDQFLSGAIHPVAFKPSKVEEIISEESKAYFSGQKSAEVVAKLIQNRVTTFLNE